uniref:Cytochrome b n=1 Tax=Goniodes dissimilis TaxID=186210 RepID=A0A9E9ES68_9NEOP|nr:cytochrome b [Goniodes dissimilis]
MSKALNMKVKGTVYNIPTPSSLSYMWNFGSLLGVMLMIQVISGILLSFQYSSSLVEAFESVLNTMDDTSLGWLIRSIHANGASFFFICVFLHIARGMYHGSWGFPGVWLSGVTILFVLMGTAFMGYVLPWGQMSLWGATVITNLLSALPYIGGELVEWVWGGFSVSSPTLTRFTSIHFLLPIGLVGLVGTHVLLLHFEGSSNPLGLGLNSDKVFFHPYFTSKDVWGMMVLGLVLVTVSVESYDQFMDPDNFSEANPMVTPPHIQPEWYFLFAYSILRSIPSKMGGVIALVMSIACLALLPLFKWVKVGKMSSRFSTTRKVGILIYFISFILLTWIGSKPVEGIYPLAGKIMSIIYFISLGVMMIN